MVTVVSSAVVLVAASVVVRDAAAQAGISVGAGVGGALNERRFIPTAARELNHLLAFVGLGVPVIPLELRGELMLRDDYTGGVQRAWIATAVYRFPLPVITPYAQLGYGDYNFGDPARSKLSYGMGVRVNLGGAGLFAEGIHNRRMDADLFTAGFSLRVGGK
jgi:hypothetical protein